MDSATTRASRRGSFGVEVIRADQIALERRSPSMRRLDAANPSLRYDAFVIAPFETSTDDDCGARLDRSSVDELRWADPRSLVRQLLV